jgi:hypothetical protein
MACAGDPFWSYGDASRATPNNYVGGVPEGEVMRMKSKTGTFLKIPYDWRWPTWAVIKERMWNPQDQRLFTPHVFGWGWSINVYELLRRIGFIDRSSSTHNG